MGTIKLVDFKPAAPITLQNGTILKNQDMVDGYILGLQHAQSNVNHILDVVYKNAKQTQKKD